MATKNKQYWTTSTWTLYIATSYLYNGNKTLVVYNLTKGVLCVHGYRCVYKICVRDDQDRAYIMCNKEVRLVIYECKTYDADHAN